eukprot:TRINITY_DN305_c0_g1_i2.p1 TRINITY_DN305_c0_g1~~TRINITY_DN305_c0_g1_i2.p1  ORF type:complete len:134 (+),score=44.46 TRINITY_DN305_c0_g1_i2:141-542(+)
MKGKEEKERMREERMGWRIQMAESHKRVFSFLLCREEEAQGREYMLGQILDDGARARLSNIRMVKPEKAKQVEDLFLRNAQTGKLTSKVTEKQLVSTLEALGTQTKSTTKIKFQRKQAFDDSDDDLGLDDDDW